MKINVDLDEVMQAIESDEMVGFCIVCGYMQDGCEPDARAYTCEDCMQDKLVEFMQTTGNYPVVHSRLSYEAEEAVNQCDGFIIKNDRMQGLFGYSVWADVTLVDPTLYPHELAVVFVTSFGPTKTHLWELPHVIASLKRTSHHVIVYLDTKYGADLEIRNWCLDEPADMPHMHVVWHWYDFCEAFYALSTRSIDEKEALMLPHRQARTADRLRAFPNEMSS